MLAEAIKSINYKIKSTIPAQVRKNFRNFSSERKHRFRNGPGLCRKFKTRAITVFGFFNISLLGGMVLFSCPYTGGTEIACRCNRY
jgi:hypothetical protein